MSFAALRTIVLLMLTLWLTLILLNNITDPGTNIALISAVASMDALHQEPLYGKGLLWRAVQSSIWFGQAGLIMIICYQTVMTLALWRAVWHNIIRSHTALALAAANLGIAMIVIQAVGLMLMGLYFGYWLHFGGPQVVHFLLLISALGLAILFNLTPRKPSKKT